MRLSPWVLESARTGGSRSGRPRSRSATRTEGALLIRRLAEPPRTIVATYKRPRTASTAGGMAQEERAPMQPKRIPLLNRSGATVGHALVDAADYEALTKYRWHMNSTGYACCKTILMHRLVLEPGDGVHTDHINGDRLDNRRCNLRAVSHAENMQNRKGAHRGGRSRYRGVYWKAGRNKKWAAQVRCNGQKHHVGYFSDERDAALAAEAFRREHMPFAQPDPALQEPPA